jgi:hypothetical protein
MRRAVVNVSARQNRLIFIEARNTTLQTQFVPGDGNLNQGPAADSIRFPEIVAAPQFIGVIRVIRRSALRRTANFCTWSMTINFPNGSTIPPLRDY